MRTRWSAYAGVSVALAGGVIVKALAQRPNFYSAAVYLSQSSANLMILSNMIFVVTCTALLGLQKLLYGPLRPIEIEQLYEKAWFAVTETCLAMTIFRGEIGAWFLVMFFALLIGKVWAWIGEGRVEIFEQQPPTSAGFFYTRLVLSLILSVAFDLSMLEFVVKEVINKPKPDMMVMFGFEFAVLGVVSVSTLARYAITLTEIAIVRRQKAERISQIRKERVEAAVQLVTEVSNSTDGTTTGDGVTNQTGADNAERSPQESMATRALTAATEAAQQPIDDAEIEVEGWETKGRWVFYLELVTDFLKLTIYLSFFLILLFFYGLPIHILRDVFMTARSFIKRVADFLRYRTATRDMNARYPDATDEDIGREDVCIICREEMRPYQPAANGQRASPVAERMRPKKLPCGHVLHFSCLRSWLARQQICPTCRTSVVPTGQNRGVRTAVDAANDHGQHPNAPNADGRQARVYQFGPLRIGVGAARGNNMMEDLQQQLADGQGQPRPPAQPPNANAPQQYGFGIRWDGMRRRERRDRSNRTVQDHINNAERQIQQEIQSLAGSMAELQQIRQMQAELVRLRAARLAAGQAPVAVANTLPMSTPQVTSLSGNAQNMLAAGSANLPGGLTLPEGWTMMPLHPSQQAQAPVSIGASTAGQLNVPASAMFTMPGRTQYGPIHMPLHPLQGPFAAHPHPQTHPGTPGTTNVSSAEAPSSEFLNSTNDRVGRVQSPEQTTLSNINGAGSSPQEATSATVGSRAHEFSETQEGIGATEPQTNGTTQRTDHVHLDNHENPSVTGSSTHLPTLLPFWGSPASTAPAASRVSEAGAAQRETSDADDHPLSSATTSHISAPDDELNGDGVSATTTATKNPTVEDLVEGTD